MKAVGPIGMDGIQQRISQIRNRMDSLFGPKPSEFEQSVAAPTKGTPPQNSVGLSPMSGYIGGFTPFNPLGAGVRIAPEAGGQPDYAPMIEKAALDAGIDPKLFSALVNQESAFDPSAVSNKGARGLAQLMPDTARQLGVTDIHDPEQNLNAGARYLAQMLRQFNNDPSLALAAYNAGPGRVQRANGIPAITETQNYVRKIMSAYEAKKAGG